MANPNPGYRLVALLESMLGQHNVTTRDAWIAVLQTQTEQELVWGMLHVQALVAEVKHMVTACAPPYGLDEYTKCFPAIEYVTSINVFHAGWNDTRGSLSADTMQPLRFGAHLIQGMCFDSEIPEEQLALLASKIEALIVALEISDLPIDLRRALVKKLVEMRLAIRMYRVVGNGGLREAWGNAAGLFSSFGDQLKDRWDNSNIRAFGELLMLIDFTVSSAQNHIGLSWIAESFRQLLG